MPDYRPTMQQTERKRNDGIWYIYNKQAKPRDRDLIEDWTSSINTLLIFAGILSAVLTALCVESQKLLQEDPLDSINTLMKYSVVRQLNSSVPPPSFEPFRPLIWVKYMNALFFSSLTCSMIASMGAVTCLQWVKEYDAGVHDAMEPEDRALRNHYRYRATDKWGMGTMIACLPVVIYISVALFFGGLVTWFWHVNQDIAWIPLGGVVIWVVLYWITTSLAVIFPSAPFKTPVSKAMYRLLSLIQFYLWRVFHTIPAYLVVVFKFFILLFIKSPLEAFMLSKQQFFRDRMELARRHHLRIADNHSWMPQEQNHRRFMHAYIWERGRVYLDKTIQLASLAWLANSIDLSEDARDKFMLLLIELNSLDDNKLATWNESDYDAPWGHIINLVVPLVKEQPNSRNILNELVVKVSRNPKFFQRMVRDLREEAFVIFTKALFNAEPPKTRVQSKKRLRSITSILSNPLWERTDTMNPHYLPALTSIWACLQALYNEESHQTSENLPFPNRLLKFLSTLKFRFQRDGSFEVDSIHHASTAWIFTLCNPVQGYKIDTHVGTMEFPQENRPLNSIVAYLLEKLSLRTPTWPDPSHISFIKYAFDNDKLRDISILRYVEYIDACLCSPPTAVITSYPETDWRWGHFHVPVNNIARAHLIQILAEYILPIAARMDESLPIGTTCCRLDRLLERSYSCPALREVIRYYHSSYKDEDERCKILEESRQRVIDALPGGDSHSLDEAWLYVFELLLGIHDRKIFRGKYPLLNHDRKDLLLRLLISEYNQDRLRSFRENILNEVAVSIPSDTWIKVISELGITAISRYGQWMAKLHTSIYLEIFSHFLFDEDERIRNALLEALFDDIRSATFPVLDKNSMPVQDVLRAFFHLAQAVVSTPSHPLNRVFDGLLSTIRSTNSRENQNLLISSLVVTWYISRRQNHLKEQKPDYIKSKLLQIVQASENAVRDLGILGPSPQPHQEDGIQSPKSYIEAYLSDLNYHVLKMITTPAEGCLMADTQE